MILKCFNDAYKGFCDLVLPFAEQVAKTVIIAFVYATLPVWIVPYALCRKIAERRECE